MAKRRGFPITLLQEKTIVLTGACGLIGSKFSEGLIKQGANVVLAEIDEKKGKQLEEKLGPKSVYVHCDISDKKSLKLALEASVKKFNRVDALVNNAYPHGKNFELDFFDMDYSAFCQSLNIHLAGYLQASQVFADYFREVGQGNIVSMGSIYGIRAPKFEIYNGTKMTNSPEYAMIKAGIIHMTKFLAKRLAGLNIRVNCLSPGGIEDGQDASFLGEYKKQCSDKGMLGAEDLIGTLTYLLSDMSKHVRGQNIVVDDGFTL